MKSVFEHFLISRFNVKIDGIPASEKRLNINWLLERLELFKNYTYPSVIGQSCRNYKWLVFFDKMTPSEFKLQIKNLCLNNEFYPCYVDSFDDQVVVYEINRFSQGVRCDYLITTRLDSDDAVCMDYIKMIQGQFQKTAGLFINFYYGYLLANKKIYIRRYPQNPFVSFIEPFSNPKTVYCCWHNKANQCGQVLNVKAKPSWMVVVHGGNIANSAGLGVRWFNSNASKEFSFQSDVMFGVDRWKEVISDIFNYCLKKIKL